MHIYTPIAMTKYVFTVYRHLVYAFIYLCVNRSYVCLAIHLDQVVDIL